MVVVRATAADLATLVAMRCDLWPGDADEHAAELAALLPRPTFAAFIARERDTAVIARERDAAVGFAEATLRDYVDGADVGAPVAYLEGLWVAPAHRHRGVASALLAAVMGWASAHGATTIGSDADDENSDGLGWHAALGFEEVGRTVNFIRAIAKPGDAGND